METPHLTEVLGIAFAWVRAGSALFAFFVLSAAATALMHAGSDGGSCPPGFLPRPAASQGAESRDRGQCVQIERPEGTLELMLAQRSRDAPRDTTIGTLEPGALTSALREKRAFQQTPSTIPGTAGTWTPAGKTTLVLDHPDHDEVNSLGLTDVAGRAGDFAYDARTGTVYSSSNAGGIWATNDLGKSWRSIAESLPVQPVGSVGFSPADGGTIIALTGDSAFSGSAFSGLGAFRSTDGGKTWQHATGAPAGVLGFKVAVDPTNPNKIYLATGGGLYRSTDAGRTYENVRLPVGEGVAPGQPDCTGDHTKKGCALANVVTDVVVRADDAFGNAGGRVVAAVGWRAGTRANADGTIQSPSNGLYGSDTGDRGSFSRLAAVGLPKAGDEIGRIELGDTTGPDQNHNYLYAIVQDAVKFRGGTPVLDVNEETSPLIPFPSNLSGLYVSANFGEMWQPVTTWEDLAVPGKGSALTPAGAVLQSYAPGVQAWYNLFVSVDPTRQAGGVPTRIAFGLEEVWTTETGSVPVVGPAGVKVIGRYYGGTTCQNLTLPLPDCPTNRPPTQSTTTHPDQHGALWVAQPGGGVSLLIANDGGINVQTVAAGEELDNGKWGRGQVAGMDTLQPYDAQIAKDGTIYAGLQDNGEIKITPDGRQIGLFGGDGFYSAVDPDDSKTVYEEYVGGVMSRSLDGGRSWVEIDPELVAPQFATPFVMDPTDAKHLIVAGRDVKVTTTAPAVAWTKVFDLGTQEKPGDAAATGINNQAVSLDLSGPNAYVGYCGYCDVIGQGTPFRSGIATNVGAPEGPEKGSSKGWHIANAAGLPERHVSSVTLDPADPRTVYVTLGNYGRRWSKPGVVSEDISLLGTGHVFKSTDAGERFRDISGNLPDAPAYKVLLRDGQLVVATEVGVYASRDTDGSEYALLGSGLPNVAALSLELEPDDPDHMIAATHGRGVWSYRFKDPVAVGATAAPCVAGAGLTAATVRVVGRALRFSFTKKVPEAVSIDLFQVSSGTRVLRERRVKRFANRHGAFSFNGKRLRDGAYFARFTVPVGGRRDVRRVALLRRRGRFAVRKPFHRPESCGLIRSLKLERPVFGGRRKLPLRASYRLGSTARVSVTVTHGSNVIKRFKAVRRPSGKTFRISLSAGRLPRGDYSVKFVIDVAGTAIRETLVARRL